MGKALVLKNTNFSINKLDTVTLSSPVPCTAISLDKSSISLGNLGATSTITPTLTPTNTTDSVVWTTSDENVATVSSGVVTVTGWGNATITATCGLQTATCSVTTAYDPDWSLIAGLGPKRLSSSQDGAGIEVYTTEKSRNCALAIDSNDTSLNTCYWTKDPPYDTSPYRLVPIPLPAGIERIVITATDYTMKTRAVWYKRTEVSIQKGSGAKVLAGNVDTTWDQESWAASVTLTKPDVEGIDSFAVWIYMKDGTEPTTKSDISTAISVQFLTAEVST